MNPEWILRPKAKAKRCSPLHRPVHLQLGLDTTSAMVPCAPAAVAPLPVLRPDWETLARLASTRSKPLDLDTCLTQSHHPVGFVAQPTNRILLGFEAQTKKPSR
jgi:hypothetical protein